MTDDHSLDAYDYNLPAELVAQEPLPDRASSRLLVVDRARPGVRHHTFAELPDLLSPGDLLVTNRSRVLPARLLGRRSGGGVAEILLVRRREPDLWEALLRPGRRLRAGDVVRIAPGFHVRIEGDSAPAARAPAEGPIRTVRLLAEDGDPRAALERHGHVPLPPYIHRPDRADDRERYQTIYAREPGSIAAPTAGLHFTAGLLDRLEARGIDRVELVLHVGPGTFRPVEVQDVREHQVDPESFTIPAATAEAVTRARREGRRVVAVGTTTTRALESACTPEGSLRAGDGQTDLLVTPGYAFRVVNGLVTNFHLPRSSLLLLVCALAGREKILAAYRDAVRERYRFYSYGDAMLIV